MYKPERDILHHAVAGSVVPVYREILADMETPVSAFAKLRSAENAFLLESVEGGEKWGRYSFIGIGPGRIVRIEGDRATVLENGVVIETVDCDPLDCLRRYSIAKQTIPVDGLPRLSGGAVGYLGYDTIRLIEAIPDANTDSPAAPDGCFLIADRLVIFDNQRHVIKVVCNIHRDTSISADSQYDEACSQIDEIVAALRKALPRNEAPVRHNDTIELHANFTRPEFKNIVEKAKEYIRAGDIFQVVLSQRFQAKLDVDPFDIYRALRIVNPSPYMFYFSFGDLKIVGASPEVLVRKEGDVAELRPIAGTRPRGATPDLDRMLESELLDDAKETSEHIMLVDLGRNDLGRVCRAGTVEVNELKIVERYSHVMHLVSNVRGRLNEGLDAVDVFRATFPAGTLSGAPKVRAMEIIDELENRRRGIYGGAVGYFSYSGNMDLAIAIRTLVVSEGQIYLQAGAGIVADSDPEAEYQETVNKAAAVRRAIDMARAGLE